MQLPDTMRHIDVCAPTMPKTRAVPELSRCTQGSTGDDWHYRWNLQSYASAGFAVLGINFRGSTGFGHAFCRAISAKNGVGWNVGGEDTIACVEHTLKEYGAWIDSERVVGLGASYGGFTSNWLNGNAPKGMFKALVCHCGTFDLRSSYFSTEELFFMEALLAGLEPWLGDSARAAPAKSTDRSRSSRGSMNSAALRSSRLPRKPRAPTCDARRPPRWTNGRRRRWSSTAPRTFGSSSRRASPLSPRCSAAVRRACHDRARKHGATRIRTACLRQVCRPRCSTSPERTTTASTPRTRSCGTRR